MEYDKEYAIDLHFYKYKYIVRAQLILTGTAIPTMKLKVHLSNHTRKPALRKSAHKKVRAVQ